jgi:PPP family 3-phenylpropionic acid transporter
VSAPRPKSEGLLLGGWYFAFFAALGAFQPYAVPLFTGRGWTVAQATALLAMMPAARVVSTPLWTWWADRTGSVERTLRAANGLALLAFVPLLVPRSHAVTLGLLLVFASGRGAAGPLADALTLSWAERTQGTYGRVRAWGTAGFTLAVAGTGHWLHGGQTAAWVCAAGLAASVVLSFTLAPTPPTPRDPSARSLGALLTTPSYMVLLLVGMLHQVGLGSYDALFVEDFSRAAGASRAGLAVALGTLAEVAMMALGRGILGRWGARPLLLVSVAVSAVRWAVLWRGASVWVVFVLQVLHGFTFGGWFLASVTLADAVAPRSARASAQGVFHTVVFGVLTVALLRLDAALLASRGSSAVWGLSTVASLLATALALVGWRAGQRGT